MGIVSIVFLMLAVTSIFFTVGIQRTKNNVSWMQFYTKGSEAGFSNANIRLLKKLAQNSGIKYPTTLFWSHKQMDACIKNFISSIKQKKTEFLPENQEFLAKLYELRIKMEMDRPVFKTGISSSWNIDQLQAVKVVASEAGVFESRVVTNTYSFIGIERPDDSSLLPLNFSWKYRNIVLYFRRKNDANYCMNTMVTGEIPANEPPLLKISHSDKLIRTQNRKSPRVETHRAAVLYNFEGGIHPSKPTLTPGVKCYLEDISGSGCCVMFKGEASIGMRVVIQFIIDKMPLSVSGVVRGIGYNEAKKASLLHIEFDSIPINVKNKIFSVMFGSLADDEADTDSTKKDGGLITEMSENSATDGPSIEKHDKSNNSEPSTKENRSKT
jgi:hypothetical protein